MSKTIKLFVDETFTRLLSNLQFLYEFITICLCNYLLRLLTFNEYLKLSFAHIYITTKTRIQDSLLSVIYIENQIACSWLSKFVDIWLTLVKSILSWFSLSNYQNYVKSFRKTNNILLKPHKNHFYQNQYKYNLQMVTYVNQIDPFIMQNS